MKFEQERIEDTKDVNRT